MARLKRSQKSGLPQGTLVHIGDAQTHKPSLSITVFTKKSIQFIENATLEQIIANKKNKIWIHADGIHDVTLIDNIGKIFDIHPLSLEDAVNTEQRPKLDEHKHYLFVILKLSRLTEQSKISQEQVSIFLTKNAVITLFERPTHLFKQLQSALLNSKKLVQESGTDFIFSTLLDSLVDNYFIGLESLSDELDNLESHVINTQTPSSDLVKKLHLLKRENVSLIKSVWPLREVFSKLLHTTSSLVSTKNKPYLADIYDHLVQIVDAAESYREALANIFEIYMANQNNRLNETMRVLTVISTIFIPLTFIVGIYGMNFRVMPELQWEFGYYIILIIMAFIAYVMIKLFRKKSWI